MKNWIIAHDGTRGDQAYMLECLRCGATQKFNTPIYVDYWVKVGKVFFREHKRCRENIYKSDMVSNPKGWGK